MKHQRIVHWLVIFLGLLTSTGSSLKAQESQKFDLRVSELSGTPIQDIPPKVERLEGDLKSRLDSEGVGEILVYTFAPRTTKDPNEVFVLEISSFSPLVEVEDV